ncbi:UNVERIFIED_CONTAM: hypothetical protein HDU68_000622 [Siphonaria sp. JEL0065]|nr:hypothetical protein HDU68_000622 [Siphonaria sp. JEL0065]
MNLDNLIIKNMTTSASEAEWQTPESTIGPATIVVPTIASAETNSHPPQLFDFNSAVDEPVPDTTWAAAWVADSDQWIAATTTTATTAPTTSSISLIPTSKGPSPTAILSFAFIPSIIPSGPHQTDTTSPDAITTSQILQIFLFTMITVALLFAVFCCLPKYLSKICHHGWHRHDQDPEDQVEATLPPPFKLAETFLASSSPRTSPATSTINTHCYNEDQEEEGTSQSHIRDACVLTVRNLSLVASEAPVPFYLVGTVGRARGGIQSGNQALVNAAVARYGGSGGGGDRGSSKPMTRAAMHS